jgi:hypothetical protein
VHGSKKILLKLGPFFARGGSTPHPNKPAVVSVKCCYGVLVVGTVNLKLCMAACVIAFSQRKFRDRNEYQAVSWGHKDSRCIGLTTLPTSCADCLEIWDP